MSPKGATALGKRGWGPRRTLVLTPGRRSHRGTEQGKTTVRVVFTGSLWLLARIVSGPRWRLGKCEYVLGIKLRFLNQPPVNGRGKGGRNLPEFLEKVLEF